MFQDLFFTIEEHSHTHTQHKQTNTGCIIHTIKKSIQNVTTSLYITCHIKRGHTVTETRRLCTRLFCLNCWGYSESHCLGHCDDTNRKQSKIIQRQKLDSAKESVHRPKLDVAFTVKSLRACLGSVVVACVLWLVVACCGLLLLSRVSARSKLKYPRQKLDSGQRVSSLSQYVAFLPVQSSLRALKVKIPKAKT